MRTLIALVIALVLIGPTAAQDNGFGGCVPGWHSVTVGNPPVTYDNVPLVCSRPVYASLPGYAPVGSTLRFRAEAYMDLGETASGTVIAYHFTWGPGLDERAMRYSVLVRPGYAVPVAQERALP